MHIVVLLAAVLRVNWSNFHSAEAMAQKIQTEYNAMRSIRSINWDQPPANGSSTPLASAPILKAHFPTVSPETAAKPSTKEGNDGHSASLAVMPMASLSLADNECSH